MSFNATPEVSVALCTYNGEEHLAEQLRSILAQSVLPDEIIISDDGSSDGTLAMVRRELAPVAARVRILEGRAGGVTANFARALAACRGEIILLSDQDDRWATDRVRDTRDLFRARAELDFLFADAELVDGAGRPLGFGLFDALEFSAPERIAVHNGHGMEVFIRRNVATGATSALRRRLVERARPFPEEWLHDEWLAIIAAATGTIDVHGSRVIDYRQHGSNVVGAEPRTLQHKIARVLQPRGDRNRGLARRSALLRDRLEAMPGVDPAVLARVAEKARVEELRASMPALRLARIPRVIRLLSSSAYARVTSQGLLEAARDLLQPA